MFFASLMVHTEKVIRVLPQKGVAFDLDEIDKIASVCCALTNVSESAAPFQRWGCQ